MCVISLELIYTKIALFLFNVKRERKECRKVLSITGLREPSNVLNFKKRWELRKVVSITGLRLRPFFRVSTTFIFQVVTAGIFGQYIYIAKIRSASLIAFMTSIFCRYLKSSSPLYANVSLELMMSVIANPEFLNGNSLATK